ncbi:hypothetical protein BKA66DRAFT_570283 [Pyrenochaeta sp. MPI-SDFR-AT-0127]|nr:hypothetical protein BKA66DRAFT_570283 [Pyrenochaeta sp. MPI-SDFR-AT-0127]
MENTCQGLPYKSNRGSNKQTNQATPLPQLPPRIRMVTEPRDPENCTPPLISGHLPPLLDTGLAAGGWQSYVGQGSSSLPTSPSGYNEVRQPHLSQFIPYIMPGGGPWGWHQSAAILSEPLKCPPWQPEPQSAFPSTPWAPSYLPRINEVTQNVTSAVANNAPTASKSAYQEATTITKSGNLDGLKVSGFSNDELLRRALLEPPRQVVDHFNSESSKQAERDGQCKTELSFRSKVLVSSRSEILMNKMHENLAKDERPRGAQPHNEENPQRKKAPGRFVVSRSVAGKPGRSTRAGDKISRKRKMVVTVDEKTEEGIQQGNGENKESKTDSVDVNPIENEEEWEKVENLDPEWEFVEI